MLKTELENKQGTSRFMLNWCFKKICLDVYF